MKHLIVVIYLALKLNLTQSQRSPGSCPSWWEPIPPSELSFYWPGPCSRCHVLAETDADIRANCRNCTIDSGGYSLSFDNPQRLCWLHHPPAGQRRSLRSRIKGTPSGVSYVKLLAELLRGRKVLWFGDSLAQQFKHFLAMRASEVGVDQSILLEDETFIFKESLAGPAYFEHHMGHDRKSFPWQKWDESSVDNIARILKKHGEQGAIVVYNAGLHNTPAGQSKKNIVMNASQLAAVEDEYRIVVRHTMAMLAKVVTYVFTYF